MAKWWKVYNNTVEFWILIRSIKNGQIWVEKFRLYHFQFQTLSYCPLIVGKRDTKNYNSVFYNPSFAKGMKSILKNKIVIME
jgi:hypothetical protein